MGILPISIEKGQGGFTVAKNMIIGQSGGPTVAINASLSGAIQQAMKSPEIGEIYGALNGLEGLLKENIIDLRASMRSAGDFQRLEATPSMALGSCRFKLPNYPHEAYDKLREIFRRYEIGYFFYIGGNDSMDTVLKLSNYFKECGDDVKCMGIPKTVDNDLPVTDHTPGFGSAAKYIATSLIEVAHDSAVYDLPAVTIVEIMGRNAGWLTAAACLARNGTGGAPHMILLPESAFDPDAFVSKVKELQAKTKSVIIAVSEGIKFADGSYVASSGTSATDAFGHAMLAGVGGYLKSLLQDQVGCKARAVELSVLQRSASHCSSGTDIREAVTIGARAVELAAAGETGAMVVFRRICENPYLVSCDKAGIGDVANLEKTVPASWITPGGWDVTEQMDRYLRPLIQGNPPRFEKDGLPDYFALDKTIVKR